MGGLSESARTMKPIRFSHHARLQAKLRGAGEAEIIEVIQSAPWESAEQARHQARKVFPFGMPSPVNQQTYDFKTVHAIFVEEEQEAVVVTILVYYWNSEAAQ